MQKPITIVVADDDPDDRLLIEDAFKENKIGNKIEFVEDGEELLSYLRRRDRWESLAKQPLPGLILLDLNMPRMDGRECLEQVKADEKLKSIPIVILTTSEADRDVARSYELQANCYISKPVDLDQFIEVVAAIEQFWFSIVKLPARAA